MFRTSPSVNSGSVEGWFAGRAAYSASCPCPKAPNSPRFVNIVASMKPPIVSVSPAPSLTVWPRAGAGSTGTERKMTTCAVSDAVRVFIRFPSREDWQCRNGPAMRAEWRRTPPGRGTGGSNLEVGGAGVAASALGTAWGVGRRARVPGSASAARASFAARKASTRRRATSAAAMSPAFSRSSAARVEAPKSIALSRAIVVLSCANSRS